MYLDLLGLQAFIAIAETGHFRQAAEHLAISQPALTRRIQRLERVLGAALFVRTTRPVRLTRLGEALLPQVQDTLTSLSHTMRAAASNDKKSSVRIAILPTVATRILGEAIVEFRTNWPNHVVEVLDVSQSELVTLSRDSKVQFAIGHIGSQHWDLEAEVLHRDPFVLVSPSLELPATKRKLPVTWRDLTPLSLIAIGAMSGNRRLVDGLLDREKIEVRWQYEVQHLGTAIHLVSQGVGHAVLPRSALHDIDQKRITVRCIESPSLYRNIGVMQARGTELDAAALNLKEILKTLLIR